MKKLGNNLGKMIKGTRRFSNVHIAFVIFIKMIFWCVLNRVSQLLKIMSDIIPCLNSIKGCIFGRPTPISLP